MQRREVIEQLGHLPAPDPALFGLSGADADWVARRQTPHPPLYDEPLPFDAARVATLARTFVDCIDSPLATIAVSRQRARGEPGWPVVEIATGHDAMISAPAALLAVRLDAARREVCTPES